VADTALTLVTVNGSLITRSLLDAHGCKTVELPTDVAVFDDDTQARALAERLARIFPEDDVEVLAA
jgi:hypothetical protein